MKELTPPNISQYDYHVYTDKELTTFELASKLEKINVSLTGIMDSDCYSSSLADQIPIIDYTKL